jgi:hypothetical protein
MLTSRKNRFEEINQLLLVGKRSCVRKFLNWYYFLRRWWLFDVQMVIQYGELTHGYVCERVDDIVKS